MARPAFLPNQQQPKPDYPSRFGTRKAHVAAKHTPPGASASSKLDGAISALQGYIGAEPDAADKATAQGIISQVKALQAKDRRDTGSAKSMALGRA